jgi:ion channel-forming bestrophin family protein
MIVPDRKMSWFRLLFSLRGSTIPRIRARLFGVFLVSVIATALFHTGHGTDLTVVPFTLISLALGVFLGFRNNTAYERFWEGRKLWGKLVNDTRSFARMVLTLISTDAKGQDAGSAESVRMLQRELVYRLIGYVHALRMHLRNQLSDLSPLEPFFPAGEVPALRVQRNIPNAILLGLAERLADARRLSVMRDRDALLFEPLLNSIVDTQGGCERIRNTPTPWSYTVLIHSIVAIYCFALPFGLVATTKLLTPIVVVLIAYAFLGLDAVGDEIEEPFGLDYNDLPLSTLSRMIEVNLRQTLGESELPPLLEPDKDNVLY